MVIYLLIVWLKEIVIIFISYFNFYLNKILKSFSLELMNNLMLKLKSILKNRIFQHVSFWLIYWILSVIAFTGETGNYQTQFKQIGLVLPLEMIGVYITLYFLIPKFLFTRRYFLFITLLILIPLGLGFIQRFNDVYIIGKLLYPKACVKWHYLNIPRIAFGIFWIYALIGITSSIKLFKHWYKNKLENQELIKGKLEAELKTLKAQINPHFLFNTLNNLYGLALEDSEKTAKSILKLSDILHYLLHECNEQYVSLKKEIKLINDYVSLEKLRYSNRLDVKIEIIGETSKAVIPPMILLPFVENAFKHGISKHLQKAYVNILLTVKDNELGFYVENSKSDKVSLNGSDYAEGIGLKNVKKRLEILYNDNFNLDIVDKKESFRINLSLGHRHNN